MNIYLIVWDQNGYNLSAVVVSDSESQAVSLLHLDESYETVESVKLMGVSIPGIESGVVVQESL